MNKSKMRSFVSRWSVIVALGVAIFGHSASAAPNANSNHIVVMISVDGLAGFYLDDPKAEMPNIRALAASGARAASMKASVPTVTWPNHTTLVTGVQPAKHGVVGNNYFDRAAGRKVVLIADPEFDKDQIVKVPTLYDVAKSAGLKTAGIRWPATRNAKTLDWTMPDVGSDELLKQYSTPSLVTECAQAGLGIEKLSKTLKDKEGPDAPDEIYTRIFDLILREHRPNLALLHIVDVDHTQHMKGPRTEEAYAAVKIADKQVGDVWETLKQNFPGKATLVIVSDHGFSEIKRMILPNVILRNAGIIKASEKKGDADVFIVPQGGSAFIYVRNEAERTKLLQDIRKAFTGVEGVTKVVGTEEFKAYGVADPKVDPHAPDLILFGGLGFAFGDTAAGTLPFEDKPERKGTHGHDPSIPDLHATFVAWGEGVKAGVRLGEISNQDVAPTVAKILGVSLPDTDGKPLTEILTK